MMIYKSIGKTILFWNLHRCRSSFHNQIETTTEEHVEVNEMNMDGVELCLMFKQRTHNRFRIHFGHWRESGEEIRKKANSELYRIRRRIYTRRSRAREWVELFWKCWTDTFAINNNILMVFSSTEKKLTEKRKYENEKSKAFSGVVTKVWESKRVL